MKKPLLLFLCLICLTQAIPVARASGLKELWRQDYEGDYHYSSVHYTSNTVIVVYSDKNQRLYMGKLNYCNGSKINENLLAFPKDVFPKTIEAYENRLFFVSSGIEEKSFEVFCTDLNLSVLWSHIFVDDVNRNNILIEAMDDLLVVHINKAVLVFELKTGKLLSKLETAFFFESMYKNHVLTLTDKLSMVDPFESKTLWSIELPENGASCFGVRNDKVMLALNSFGDADGSTVVCLDANTGKTVFEIDYSMKVVDASISGEIFGIVYRNGDGKHVLDAFDVDGWFYMWSSAAFTEVPLFTKNAIYYVYRSSPTNNHLDKVNVYDGGHYKGMSLFFLDDNESPRFFRNITFQGNRTVVAYAGITCYIDESY